MESSIIESISSDEEDFNEDWIDKIKTENKIYNDFFITENNMINIKIYYINHLLIYLLCLSIFTKSNTFFSDDCFGE